MRIFSERSPEPICERAGRVELGPLAFELAVVEPRAQDAHRLLAVLQLRLLVLHRDDDPGRDVRDADGRVGRVDGLAAGAGRAVDVDLEVVGVDLDLDLLGLGHHRDRGGRGVDAAGALGLGHALDAMRAALPLEDGVRAVALDRERDLLVAAAVRWARRELLDLEAAPLGIAREHPVDVAGPEGSLVAADALAHLDDHVLAVGRVARDHRQPELAFEPRGSLLELRDELSQIRIVARGCEVLARAAPLLRELVRAFELLQAAADLRRFPVVVVDGRVGQPLLRLPVGALELVDQAVEGGGHAADYVSRASSVISGTPASAFETGQFSFAASRELLERDAVDAGDAALDRERDARDALARLEGDRRGGPELVGRRVGSRETGRQRHREARRVCRGDQLLGAGQAAGLVLGARLPRDAEPAERAARRRVDRAGALEQAAVPGDLCHPLRCHYAITSTRDGSPGTFSSASTSLSARIETSSWSSVGSRVVSRCSHSPGASSVISSAVVLVLAREADQLVREPGDHRQQQDPRRDQPVPRGPAEEREHEDRDHHHPEQERRPAARVDQRVALHDLGLERLAGLVGVDRLVLGGVVLEDAAQVGQERDQEEIGDEDRDADQPLDDHETLAVANRQLIRDQRRARP